jgi:hypothetical protein
LKRRRLIGFILAIALGLAAALVYGWVIAPPQPKNTTLASLRLDYQADYVLMVAESYPELTDVPAALDALKQLNAREPIKAVDQALLTAQSLGYSDADMHLMVNLELRIKQFGGGQ